MSKFMTSAEIREAFLRYFEQQQHSRIASSSLIPGNDPTLLFTNAGMVQFKDVFLGQDKRDYIRATSSQRCVRAGGKHNDLENVGYTARHHTFFEMLGNFSFGDYFKRDAIQFAWEFLTSPDWLGISQDKLTVTVYQEDDEAYAIWKDTVGVPAERIIRIGDKGGKYQSDNFWAMGDTGPCGPCTEIFYDHGEHIWGGPPGSPEEDGDRFIEIWNVVFMQYERSADGSMKALPKPSVDTGMGLERIAAVMQGVHNNYEIDLFQHLLKAASQLAGGIETSHQSLRVIADHIRSTAFLIIDGVQPSNEGRGYVLRRIMRRAIRHGHKLGIREHFLYRLVQPLAQVMGQAYPELVEQTTGVEKVILAEEEQFAKTLDNGMQILNEALQRLSGKELPGEVVFKLYDTYGFPVDLTNDIARELEITLDMAGYDAAMQEQRKRSQAAGQFAVDYTQAIRLDGQTEFTGYEDLADQSTVLALFQGEKEVEQLQADEQGIVVLAKTPFYAESGGQVGDSGYINTANARLQVLDVSKAGSHHLHHVQVLEGTLTKGEQASAEVASEVRLATARNHSATHLLHAALREILGDHVMQKGSLNDSEKLRFDFSHSGAVTTAELQTIEDRVNEQIRLNSAVETDLTDMETAKQKGAMALFGEKYGEEVRVLTMGGGFSVELCGGTHVQRTGDIGVFRITSESGVAAGVRRIEAITAKAALEHDRAIAEQLNQVAHLLKTPNDNVLHKLEQLLIQQKKLEKELQQTKQKLASGGSGDLSSQAVDVNGIKVLAAQIDGVDRKTLLSTMDQLRSKLGDSVILLASVEDGAISLVAGVSKSLTDKLKAGDLMRYAAERLGGKGGGRPDSAQGGGTDVAALPEVLASIADWVSSAI